MKKYRIANKQMYYLNANSTGQLSYYGEDNIQPNI